METNLHRNKTSKMKLHMKHLNLGKNNPMYGKGKQVTKNMKIITPSFCYMLGAVKGDGWLSNGTLGLEVNDYSFIFYFKKQIEKWSNYKFKIYQEKNQKSYCGEMYSINICKYLKKFNINKIKKTSLVNKNMFLKGMYDSEGGINNHQIYLYNTNLSLLNLCKKLLSDNNIQSNININIKSGEKTPFGINKKNLYVLYFGQRKQLKIFCKNINFIITRKKNKLIKDLLSYKNGT